jgi:hypothetical protein
MGGIAEALSAVYLGRGEHKDKEAVNDRSKSIMRADEMHSEKRGKREETRVLVV